ncbi:MAG TPA: DNA repair protein RecN, partial [Casimicrobiaceae bacterium]
MLRALSVRNFAVVEAIDVEFDAGFTVLTGETGAGKSILVDALALILGGRFDALQLRAGAGRAELSAVFDVTDCPAARTWLDAEGLDGDGIDADRVDVDNAHVRERGIAPELVLRRVQDAQGRSRAWINGQLVTLAQLAQLGGLLVDLHGQHAHQALAHADAQRALLDAFGGATALAGDVTRAWREQRDAEIRRSAAATEAATLAAERDELATRLRELEALAVTPGEWDELASRQRRLAHAKTLQQTAGETSDALAEGDDALTSRLARIGQRLEQAATIDPELGRVAELLAPAAIQLDEAARALRDYLRRQELDPGELERAERRIAAMHETARRYRVRPEELTALEAATRARLDEIAQQSDFDALAAAAAAATRRYEALAGELSAQRRAAAAMLGERVTTTMQTLAMKGGRFDVRLLPLGEAASFGRERVEFVIATHPQQEPGPLARVASGGELARVALAIQVSSSEVAAVETLVFDEVDSGIGGAVAATVGRLLQSLGGRRQVLCVTHLAQVAAHADHHYRVVKTSRRGGVSSSLDVLAGRGRIDELARMLSGSEVTAKTIAHADELYRKGVRKGVRSCL